MQTPNPYDSPESDEQPAERDPLGNSELDPEFESLFADFADEEDDGEMSAEMQKFMDQIKPLMIVVIETQTLNYFDARSGTIKSYPISTSQFGVGYDYGSEKTPLGRFKVCDKIGEGQPIGTLFREREVVEDVDPETAMQSLDGDLILTRILRLDGMDPENANTYARCIYIHGTNREDLIGQAVSHGCIRMKNSDIKELYDLAPEETRLIIVENIPNPEEEGGQTPV